MVKSTCPEDKKTTREEMKNLMFKLEETYPKAIDRLMTSLCNIDMKIFGNKEIIILIIK